MACVAVTSLMRTIELEFLQSNPRLMFQDRQHIKSLHEKLGLLQMFLDESDKKADYNEELNEVTAKIREVAEKAEYNIEAELIEEIIHDETVDQTLWRVLEDVEQLMEMTKNAHQIHLAKDLQILHLGSPSSGGQSPLKRTPKLEDTIMVGHAEEFEEFKDQLLRSSKEQRQVMALVGMGGIGKTTFARRIYDESGVKSYFDCCGWATMSQDLNKRQVLLDLCCSVMPMRDDLYTQNSDELAEQLQKSLKGRRYLIVVDDIWSTEAWDNVQRCFPENDTSSRILLTTRLQEVASYACSSKSFNYDMRFLNSDESWNLFCQKLLTKECLHKEFETIGRKIVENCRGLPLTVAVLAGHLSANMAVDEWKSVESTLNSLVNVNLPERFSRILSLSYNNLPCHLKSCFLYLGGFPEDSEIEIKKVVRLWIAEGFIKEVSEKTVEESGEEYLEDLMNRSLIMKSGRSSNSGKVETCMMHDLLHDLCSSKAKKEKLLCTRDGIELHHHHHHHHHRNVVHSDGNRWLSLKITYEFNQFSIALNKSRSILCFDMRVRDHLDWYLISLANNAKLTANSFKMLRVLDLTLLDYKGSLPSSDIIDDVVLLRYLALASNWLLTSIPVSRNRNLQTLVICGGINGVHMLPDGIWELPQLRHLDLYHQLPLYTPKVVQLNLQTVYWLKSFQCTKQVFLRIPNVKELGIIARGCRSHRCLDSLNCLKKLEKLKVQGTYCPIKLRPYTTFPQNLKEISFAKTLMPWEAMNVMSMLPKLEVLKLKNHACVGQNWKLSVERGFPELKLLLISDMDLKHWEVADDVDDHPFPKLERLVLRNCFELKEMPSWIENLCDNLKSVQLKHCHASLVNSARKIEEEQRDCYGEEYGFQILEFHTQSEKDEDEKNSQNDEEMEEDEKSINDAEGIEGKQQEIDEAFDEEQKYEEDLTRGIVCVVQSVRIEARSLGIAWGDDPSYWTWTRNSGYEVAELLRVWWLDIRGTVDTRRLHKMTCYSAYLLYKIKPRHYGIDLARSSLRYVNDNNTNSENQVVLAGMRSHVDSDDDEWMEIMLGEFNVCNGNEGVVDIRLWNTESNEKSGLVIKAIEVRPK
ncbi:PREDICTED: putative late blight resistance protein homolog R1B-17 isoform X2 [Ipomoea nil]|uniref:putative late blight resistance protein homolog R1B-17 isoform X2 n=1 Tax=Ipomoea nil TaxID=35883 RepID=UPI0009012CB7|nr:PREDICTED: putative late blight resistance protein homolog R1B-17 isoform X2 [Ipomoea nil]